jgi:hypothetical protein
MDPAAEYRRRATEADARARSAADPGLRGKFRQLADRWRTLAREAEGRVTDEPEAGGRPAPKSSRLMSRPPPWLSEPPKRAPDYRWWPMIMAVLAVIAAMILALLTALTDKPASPTQVSTFVRLQSAKSGQRLLSWKRTL